VLPAGGVALCWLLLMTLWLPLLDYARSPRPWVQRVATLVPAKACIAAPGLAPATVAALEHLGHWTVDARPEALKGACRYAMQVARSRQLPAAPAGWELVGKVQRPTDRGELTLVYRRRPRG